MYRCRQQSQERRGIALPSASTKKAPSASPPTDLLPARRGGRPSSETASAAGRPVGFARLPGARRGLDRPARALAAAALLALTGALALPATAQADVLVSNIGQPETTYAADLDDGYYNGQAFSVGAGGGHYTLTSIEIPIYSNGIAAEDISLLSVSVWSVDSSGNPSSSLHPLTNPSSITVNTTATFTAAAGATLEAGETYAIVVFYNWTLDNYQPTLRYVGTGEDANSATGWTIADSTLYRAAAVTNWSSSAGEAFPIRVNGTAGGGTPTPLSTLSGLVVNDGSTDLTLTPTFASGTYAYDASVASTVAEVTVTPTGNDSGATIDYLDVSDMTLADANASVAGQQVALAEGDNVIKVKVTSSDTTTTQTYAVTVNRAAAPTCTLNTDDYWCGVVTVGPVVSGGNVIGHGFVDIAGAPGFDTGALSNTEFSVGNSYTIDTAMTGTESGGGAGLLLFSLASDLTAADEAELVLHVGTASFAFSDAVSRSGSRYEWANAGLDWSSENYVTLRLRGAVVSTDATLSGLAVNDGSTDVLTFTSNTTTYTAMVANDVETLTFTATKGDDGASVAYLDSGGNPIDDADTAAGHQVPLDVGANVITVRVTAEDGSATDYTVTVNRAAAATTVTIAADHASFTAALDDVTFTLTRTEDPAAALDVAVALTQDRTLLASADLAQTVTFGAGEATATLIIQNHKFASHTVTEEEATLTATVQDDGTGYEPGSPNTASTRIVVADPAVTASFEQTAYTFAEDATGNDATITVILRTATGVPSPNRQIFFSISTKAISGQAEDVNDYVHQSELLSVSPSDFTPDGADFTARKEVTLAIVDDAIYEPDETLNMLLEPGPATSGLVAFRQPDGTACPGSGCDATVTIVDDDGSTDATLSGLAVNDGSTDLLTFVPGTTTYTAMVANDVETLTFTATKGDDGASVAYLDSDGNAIDDADTMEDGHQVPLDVGANVITVRVTAQDGTTTETYTVTVTVTVRPFDPTLGICGRTEAVRDAIVAAVSGVSACANVTDAHLAAITELDLESTGISSLRAGDFSGLTALGILFLYDNSLSELPAGVFDGLTALFILRLDGNSLSELPAGVFDGLTALTHLNLNNNSLSELPAGVFDELTALTHLYLHSNSLSELPAGDFSGLTALTYLDLRDNSLSNLQAGVFENLTALTELYLNGNPGAADFVPTANAGGDHGVAQGAAVTLDGSASSGGAWGTNVTYQWTKTSGATVTLSGADTDSASFTAPSSDGDLVFTLTVTGRGEDTNEDPYEDTDTATVRVGAASTDATLSGLAVSGGGTDLLTFAPGATTYTAMVANDVETLTFTATKGDDGASVAYLDSDGNAIDDADTMEDGHQVPLDVGANVITVRVTAEDGTTTETYTVTVTRAAATTVTIAADHASFTAVLDQVTFTLTRTGDPADELDVSVALTQDKDLIGSDRLAQTVTFRAGEATATLRIVNHFFAGNTVTGETALTATVQDGSGYVPGSTATASTRIRVADPAVTASFEQAAYTFDEAAGDATLAVILRTATGVPVPHADIFLSINSETITGGASPDDFEFSASSIKFVPSDFTADGMNFTARKEVTLAIVDDELDEPDEALTVILEPLPSTQAVVALRQPDGTACPGTGNRCDATVTIVDNDASEDATLSGLAVNDGSADLLTFVPGTTTYTAMVANDVETLTFTATKGDDGASVAYLDSDGNPIDDADTAAGHQVPLDVGANVITVRVTAEDGSATLDYTVTVNRAVLPVVTIAKDKNVFVENEGAAGFTLSRTGPTAAALTVTVEVTQQADRDLLPDGAAAERTVTFAVGSATAALTVALKDDDLASTNGELTVEVQAGMGYTVGDPGSATLDVVDSDTGRPTPANLMASPGAGAGEVVLSWDAHAPHLTFTRHQYRYKTDGDYLDAWTDIPNSGQHGNLAGDGSNLTGYTVTGLVGGQVHSFQVRTYTLVSSSAASNEAMATPRSAAVSFGVGSYSVDEGGAVDVTVQLDAAPGREVVVPVSAAGAGGATPPGETGADWSGVPENVTFGATDTAMTFTLAATQDLVDDDGESVALSFGTLPDGVTAGSPSQATVTIADDDTAATTCTLNTGDGDIWCGVVTVGPYSTGGTLVGYGFFDAATDTGALPDTEFTVGLNSYTIDGVWTLRPPFAGSLNFSLTSALAAADLAKLVLHVGSTSLEFSNASGPDSSQNYQWLATGLDWSSETSVTLRLRALPDAPTNFTAKVGDTQVALAWKAAASDSGVTGHEFRYKTDGDYPDVWTAIEDSGPDEANEDSFTVTGLTNEKAHTFELRAVNAAGGGDAAMAGPVTPTPGICGRTQKIQDVILAELADVDDCAAVTVANLASITQFGFFGLGTSNQGITSLQKGDFAGLTSLTILNLSQNGLTSLPEGIFAGLTALNGFNMSLTKLESLPEGAFDGLVKLQEINLASNRLTGVPEGAFSNLTALEILYLSDNDLDSLPEELFSDLTALTDLTLGGNDLDSLPEELFSGLTALDRLDLKDNDLDSLPHGLFSGLTALTQLTLSGNDLNSLPVGLFSGLTALANLTLGGNSTDPMELTVTVERVGTTDQVRAKVLAGAPFAVDIPVTLVSGTLAGSVTALSVAAGEVYSEPVTVTRTAGTTAAVTVDVDLSTQPTLPSGHEGYIFKKATTNLPATILPAAGASTDATLSDLVVNDGTTELTLTPTFASGMYTYTAMVESTVDEVTVTATKNETNATIEYLDASDMMLDDAGTEAGQQVTLVDGDNVINVKVTAADGSTTLTYAVTVNRPAAVTPCTLNTGDIWCGVVTVGTGTAPVGTFYGYSALSSWGSLSPNSFMYDGSTISVIALQYLAGAGGDLRFGFSGNLGAGNFVLHVGSQSFTFTGGERTYNWSDHGLSWSVGDTVDVRLREAAPSTSTDATLSALVVNDGNADLTLTPTFATSTYAYAASVASTVAEVTVTPTTTDTGTGTTIEYLDASDMTLDDADTSETGQQVTLADGDNVIKVKVTAEDGNATLTYAVTVTREVLLAVSAVFGAARYDVTEGESVTVTVNLSEAPGRALTIPLHRQNGIGVNDADLTGVPPSVMFAATATSASFAVMATDNDVYNGGDDRFVLLEPFPRPDGVFEATTGATTTRVYILDNEDAPSPAPAIDSVAVTSTPVLTSSGGSTPDTYGEGEDIEFTVTFTAAVDVVGDPIFRFALGNSGSAVDTDAAYASGSGTTNLVFGYTVLSGDMDDNGIFLYDGTDLDNPDGPVRLDSDDSIVAVADVAAADLAWPSGRETQSGHKVDGSRTVDEPVEPVDTPACTLNTGDLWCGVVTVGTYSNGVGFTDSDGALTDNDGDQTITIGSDSYTVSSVVVLANPAGALVMGLDTRFPTSDEPTLEFHIGGSPLKVSEATFDVGVGYYWQNSGLSWSVDDMVDVRLRRSTAPTITAPTIDSVAVTSTPMLTSSGGSTPDTYGAGETIEISVTFGEAVDATAATDFVLSVAGRKRAPLLQGSGTETLVFGYTVESADEDTDGIWIGDQTRTLVGNRNGDPQTGAITSAATDVAADLTHSALNVLPGHKVDGSRDVDEPVEPVDTTCTLNPGDLWCGVVTVEEDSSFYGFVDASDTGALSDTGFSVGTNSYTIDDVFVGVGTLSFGLTSALEDDDQAELVLHVGSAEFAFSAAVAGINDDYRWLNSGLDWSETRSVTLRLRDTPAPTNNAPAFTSSATFNPAENQTTVGTVEASDSDAGDDITGYALTGGADQALFSIGSTSGVLTFQAAPNYENPQDANTDNAYLVEVQATGGTGGRERTATQTITVTVRDDDSEAPGAPDAPSVSAASGTSLRVTWLAPDNAGPAITDYDYRYRTTSPQGAWVEVTNTTITALSATIAGLAENTEYDVQVRATNDEGTGGWSASGSGAPDANAAPAFTSSPTFRVEENGTAAGTVEAEDSDAGDAVTGYALTGGADQALFSIGSTSGVLTFQAAPNYENAQDADTDNAYLVEVQATSGTGDREQTATQTITVTVTDANEQPDTPAKPTLAAVSGSATSLAAGWTKPGLNGGPDITGYNVNYRVSTATAWETFTHSGAGVSRTITGLTASTSYQVRVQALNGETDSDWSEPSDAVRTNAETATTCTLNPGDLWCGVVTVEEDSSFYGFVDASDTGALSDTGFSVGTNSYTIDDVFVGAGTLSFGLTSALEDDDQAELVLHVGSAEFAFSAAVAGINDDYRWLNSGLDWSETRSVTLRLRDTSAPTNNAPSFTSSATFNPAENQTAVGTVEASDSDAGDDITGYALSGGADQALFSIGSTSGVLTFQAAPNYEDPQDANTDNAYLVEVQATGGTGDRAQTATQTITVTVGDANEQPDKPAKPTLAAVSGSTDSLDASWTKPGLNGGPDITGYGVEYRVSGSGTWTDWSHSGAGTATTITGLTANTEYQVRVQALNGETPSDWSEPSDAVPTNALPNNAPVFSETTPTRTVAENSGADTDVGAAVTATDADSGDTLTYSLEGPDAASFDIVSTSGQIRTVSGVDYNHEATKNSYRVTVKVTDGTASPTVAVAITVTDVDEKSVTPAKPTLAAVSGSTDSLDASWTKPGLNGGPDITGYGVEYRVSTATAWETFTHSGAGVTRTITGLTASTSYQVRVQALNGETPSDWSEPSDAVRTNSAANNAPVFSGTTATREVPENSAAGTNVGAAVTASDADSGDTLTYSLEETGDHESFDIVSTSGQIQTKTGVTYNHEATKNSYSVRVKASDSTASATIDVTINVTNVDEQTATPAKPSVAAVSGSTTSLTATWEKPDLNGGPDITGYGVEYRQGASGTWTNWSHSGTDTMATITGLTANTEYQVRVRALNGETPSDWSDPSDAVRTNSAANNAPAFTSPVAFDAAENQTVAGTVRASDSDAGDDITGYALTGGADMGFFSIGPTSGALTFKTAPNFEDAQDADNGNTYEVTVQATSGTDARVKTATQAITVTVMDDATEAPGAPDAPSVSSASVSSLTVTWPAPDNAGPEITDYDYQYRTTSPQGAWVEVTNTTSTALSATITGLAENTSYDVQVRATNDEGTGAWSTSGSGTTVAAGPDATNSALPPPQDVNAEPKLPGEIRLSWWRNPNDASRDLVDRHQYRYRVRNASTWTVDWTTVNQTLLPGTTEIRNYNSVLLKDLDAGTTYEFQVRSVDKDGNYSEAVTALGMEIGLQRVWIEADTRSVREGASLPFTLSRDQSHGRMGVIVRISETGDMLPPEGRSPEGLWHEQVYFGDGKTTIPLVLDTVNDHGGPEDPSVVTVAVMPYPLGPDNPDYDVLSKLGEAMITVTAAESSSPGGAAEPLTAAFEGLPAAHDGATAFTFRLAFSEAVSVTPEAMRTRVLTVAGGAVTGAARIDGETGAWSIAVTPDSREDLSITLAPAADCAADGAVCTADGRALSIGAAHIVSGPGPETQTQVEEPNTAAAGAPAISGTPQVGGRGS